MKLTFGNGEVGVRRETTLEDFKCISFKRFGEKFPIGSLNYEEVKENDLDVILEFKTLESARIVQDQLNELIIIWSREQYSEINRTTSHDISSE